MGIVNGSLKAELANQKANEKCLPHYPYQPFPQSLLHQQGKGGLLLELNAVPPDISKDTFLVWQDPRFPMPTRRCRVRRSVLVRTEVPEEAYWWTDAQFLPYNDGQLLTSATAYLTHALHAWVKVRSMPAGRIILHHLQMSAIESEVFKGTQSSVYPKAQPHPLGQAVGCAGVGELKVVSMRSEPLYTLMRDANNRVHCFCAIASSGVNLAVVARGLDSYFLEIFMFDFRLLQYTRPVECHNCAKASSVAAPITTMLSASGPLTAVTWPSVPAQAASFSSTKRTCRRRASCVRICCRRTSARPRRTTLIPATGARAWLWEPLMENLVWSAWTVTTSQWCCRGTQKIPSTVCSTAKMAAVLLPRSEISW